MQFAPGDVVEISTPAGLAYVQVTHTHVAYPEVVRILPGLHAERPPVSAISSGKTRNVVMIPLAGALAQGKLDGVKVGTADIPGADRRFPTFKMPIRGKKGEIVYWWLWEDDGLTCTLEDDPRLGLASQREVPTIADFLSMLG
ncbi:MAG: hypothetical protein KJ947_21110 [Alphaproteobacteria bacterium]|jgi:hypothetical protein|nr:hypothetical protein [Alphaproteobacteria bacterium]MBU1552049.1 hypothetical protein [Alphaproteobacteria bacterium]MBU2337659.1 hypothetical protein [Alphaproteobacteria bacterium]MBU2391499.1 hypothetical protein [Alphaproteobacteria bacterium]|tara:strand:- start:384 stop:812 length:429 start_codon:yes stop_codon:yes gene_type:complete